MSTSPQALGPFLGEQGAGEPLVALVETVARAGRDISDALRRGALGGVLGLAGGTNVQGEEVKRIDVVAHDTMVAALADGRHACVMASEEHESAIAASASRGCGGFAIAFDPLDGSGNIDTDMPMGTVFSIYPRSSGGDGPGDASDFLRAGSGQASAGYVLYGSSTVLVVTTGNGTHGFTLDPGSGEWLSTHPRLRIPARGRTWSANPGHRAWWSDGLRAHVAALESVDPSRKRPLGQRYVGALVADVHRTLVEGGVFFYPADSRDPRLPTGKLRLLYECAPLALVVEQAGGAASDGSRRILDAPITSLHQRTPIFIGSPEDVEEIASAAR